MLFLVWHEKTTRWFAIHAAPGTTHAEILASDPNTVVFASAQNILEPGPHEWKELHYLHGMIVITCLTI